MTAPGHVKIAITTNDLLQVDADFISARQIVFYDVGPDSSEFLDSVTLAALKNGGKKKGPGGGVGCSMSENDDDAALDRIGLMLEAMRGSAILFTKGLSDPQAVRVKQAQVFPVKMERVREIPEVIDHVQRMLTGTMPLWLRRAMGDTGHDDHQKE